MSALIHGRLTDGDQDCHQVTVPETGNLTVRLTDGADGRPGDTVLAPHRSESDQIVLSDDNSEPIVPAILPNEEPGPLP